MNLYNLKMSGTNDDDDWVSVEKPEIPFSYRVLIALYSLFQSKPTYMASSQCTSIQLPNLGIPSLQEYDDMSIKSTPISCMVEKEGESYRIYLSIGETSFILTSRHKINAYFIMKMAVKFGYFQIRLCDLRDIVRSIFSGMSAEARIAIVKYANRFLINQSVYYDELEEFNQDDGMNIFDECDNEEE